MIQRLITLMGLESANEQDVPAVNPLLHKDAGGANRLSTWNYCLAVGILNYIANSTRPDVSFATHQCARFCNDPKRSHETAIKRVGKYLKQSQEKGIILSVNRNLGLECFVDADFAGDGTNLTLMIRSA